MEERIHLHILASGSKGNAALVCGPSGTLLIDCGISCKQLRLRAKQQGVDPASVDAMLLTHEHVDHVRGVRVFAKRFAGTILATRGTVEGCADLAALPVERIAHDERIEVAGMRVQVFGTSHDVNDPIGMRISVVDDAGRELDALGWCTDTGLLTPGALQHLAGCRVLGIEANHDRHMLATGPYPPFLQARVGGDHGHLSNDQAAEALPQLVSACTQTVVGLHLSEKNNTPRLAEQALRSAAGSDTQVLVASQNDPITIW